MRSTTILLLALLTFGCSGGRGGDNGGQCAGLSLEACRDAIGCAPDLCAGCECDVTYRGCIPDDVAPTPCPQLGCPQAMCCGVTDTCTGGTVCAPPGTPQGCGACNIEPSNCDTDGDCGAPSMICEPIPCSCENNRACTAGCVDDTTCDEGDACEPATGRCSPKACDGEADCPASFDCSSGACERRACTADSDCDGYCVLGFCYQSQGTCTPPAA